MSGLIKKCGMIILVCLGIFNIAESPSETVFGAEQSTQLKLSQFVQLTGNAQQLGEEYVTKVDGVVKITSSYNIQLYYLNEYREIIMESIAQLVPTKVDRKFVNEVRTKEAVHYVQARIVNSSGVIQNSEEIHIVNEEINTPPVIIGAKDTDVCLNSDFDPKEKVTVKDKEDGDLTDKLEIVGYVDISTIGEYIMHYSVTDSGGLTTNVERKITVVDC